MKGKTGGNTSSVITLICHSTKAVKERQKIQIKEAEKDSQGWVNPHTFKSSSEYLAILRKIHETNELKRTPETSEVVFTLFDGLKRIRACIMSHEKARKLNEYNRENGIPLRWAKGGDMKLNKRA